MLMNMNYLISLASVAGALLVALVIIGISAPRRACQVRRLLAASDDMRASLQALHTELSQPKEETPAAPAPVARTLSSAPLVTADQRAGAFEMFRSGADVTDVSTALGIPAPDAMLLRKVQQLQSAEPSLS